MAKIIMADGRTKNVEPGNKLYFTNGEIAAIVGSKSWQVTIPKSHRAKVFIYTEREDDELNIMASNRADKTLGGVVLECEQSEVDFEY